MKASLLFIALLLTGLTGLAQDTIHFNNGSAIAVKLTEIGMDQVKYKQWNDPDGPTYVENKTEIQSIRLANGIVEEITPKQQAVVSIAAADTIFRRDGFRIPCKVLEITSSEISYKRYDTPNGATYSEAKYNVSSIRFSTGLVEHFDAGPVAPPDNGGGDYYGGGNVTYEHYKLEQRGSRYIYKGSHLNERQMHELLLNTKDKELISLVQSSKDAHALKFVGFGAIPLGIASLLVFSSAINMYGGVNSGKAATAGVLFAGAIACPIVSGYYSHRRTMYNRQAVKLYNEKF